MNKITLAQREALDVVKDMLDKSNTNVPEYGTKIMTLILGILNIDCRVEHTTIDITDITDTGGGKGLPINPEDGNGKINLDIPEWIKNLPTGPFSPHTPYPGQIWCNQEPEPIQTNVNEERRYVTSVSCTGNQNCITTTRNTDDCVSYTGDFRDAQTSFNDK
jgi:hypothetical protein